MTPIKTALILIMLTPGPVWGWGDDGHREVGTEALQHLDKKARSEFSRILGGDDSATIEAACNWPDDVRNTPQWEWSSPRHYVNIPRTSKTYKRERDCPDGECVTEAILLYTNQLTQAELDPKLRWQALAWLCHLVGDLHQPLHAGYKDDRGGNQYDIRYRNEDVNLHYYWDTALVRAKLSADNNWQRVVPPLVPPVPLRWKPSSVAHWTSESHALVASAVYPPERLISESIADNHWHIVRQQWQKGAWRLAAILNATLGNGRVMIGE